MVNVTQEEYHELLNKTGASKKVTGALSQVTSVIDSRIQRDAPKPIAKGRQKMPGKMNRTEAEYHEMLAARSRTGEISWWGYEKMKLKLADNTTITVDFLVITANNEVELHEVKGTWFPEHNRVKLKVAAEMYPFFRFVLCKKDKSGWSFKEI